MSQSVVNRFARLFSRSNTREIGLLWQDREIRFDLAHTLLNPRTDKVGQAVGLETQENVEDSKGTKLETGVLSVTNLRVLWTASKKKRLNISIGHDCITDVHFDEHLSRLKGTFVSIVLTTRYDGSSFMFIFSCFADSKLREVYEFLEQCQSNYRKSKMYRNLAIREMLMNEKELIVLTGEEIVDKLGIVNNLSCDQTNQDFNISMPYIQIKNVQIRESRYGPALVIEIVQKSGGYVMGFSFEPFSEMERVVAEIKALKTASDQNPVFDANDSPISTETIPSQEEIPDNEAPEQGAGHRDIFALYCATGQLTGDAQPVFNSHLGLAIEPLRDGVTIEDLWNVV